MTKIAKVAYSKSSISPQVHALGACSPEQSIVKPLNVLITRPESKAKQLALLLSRQKIANTCQALFDYQANASSEAISPDINAADIVIFVSVAAVEFTQAKQPLITKPKQLYFAIGNATKQALHSIGITKVLSPTTQAEHSEGLLNLPELQNVSGKNVVIVRGNGGREHIANSLKQRGAQVSYIESYQRVWRTLPKNIAQQWRAQQINCIVVTSNDILTALLNYLTNETGRLDNYWQRECLWVVVSERIANNAKASGLQQIVNTQGASTEILSKAFKSLTAS
ncbi:uroporphyrinogen-III synthase [Colwelliaceae bacterium MEBiC 14330]